MPPQPRRTRDDWVALALDALAEDGPNALAIEPLARRAGTSKGSVYWHFSSRDDLLAATLERWERDNTDAVIALAAAGATPRDRLRLLLERVMFPAPGAGADVERALLAAAPSEPRIADVLARVSERRVTYLVGELRQLGFSAATARRRAVLAFSIYIGQLELLAVAPAILPSTPTTQRRHIDEALDVITRRDTLD